MLKILSMSSCYYTISTDFFLELFPEFSGTNKDRIQQFLNMAQDCGSGVSQSLGAVYNEAVLYYAAHNLALSNMRLLSSSTVQTINGVGVVATSTQSSPVVSDSVGALSNSYATTKIMNEGTLRDNNFLKTEYGQKYLALVRNAKPRITVLDYENCC